MILGVSSWLSSKFGISASIIRIIFVLTAIFGAGLLAYFILWIIKLITK